MPVASTSIAAYHSLALPELEQKVLNIIESFGKDGCTVDEIVTSHPHIEYRTLSPRFAPLERKGLMYRAGDTRMGLSNRQQKIMRHSKYAVIVPPVIFVKKGKNPFLEGMKYIAKKVVAAHDMDEAKKIMKAELIKAASR